MENLVYKNEKILFTLMAIISIGFWSLIVLGTFGVALFYLLIFFIFYLFAQSALISYIKGTAIKLSPDQFPRVYSQLEACCEKLKITDIPETYILQADGILNAFATRFLKRNFIVLYTDVVDALKENPEALRFYLGHELGHIHRKHLIWGPILFPAAILPLIGAGYSRAREYTCDNYGFACCDNPKQAVAGLAVLAAGPNCWKSLKVQKYAAQSQETGGFWMSYNELISDYPWLVKRTARIIGKATGTPAQPPRRHALAWFFALFTPRTMAGSGLGSLIVIVAIIGILAAIAIPQYQTYRARAMNAAMANESQPYSEASSERVMSVVQQAYSFQNAYHAQFGSYTTDPESFGFENPAPEVMVQFLSADNNCYVAQAIDTENGASVQFDCNGLK